MRRSDSCITGKVRPNEEWDISSKEPIKISTMSASDLNILSFRVDCLEKNAADKYLKNYKFYYKSCCDPFKKHQIKITTNLITLDLNTCIKYKLYSSYIKLIPGRKVCKRCINTNKIDGMWRILLKISVLFYLFFCTEILEI